MTASDKFYFVINSVKIIYKALYNDGTGDPLLAIFVKHQSVDNKTNMNVREMLCNAACIFVFNKILVFL